ncbi:MAG: helix-turn-helix transcriptional regulator [Lachnospiraceae bacterium]|nr:helix-turn-helix transcriptional regulator [Lachnospiraceae bacterium]
MYRKLLGMSQRELAETSGVNIRTIQQYETGAKDINKASVQNVVAMARALHCDVEDLMEL